MSPDRLLALRACCCKEDDLRPLLEQPFGGEWLGEKWICATNGHMIALVKHADPPMVDGAPVLAKVLPKKLLPVYSTTLAALREWAGVEQFEACEVCGGSGLLADCPCLNCKFPCPCPECRGGGKWRSLRYGQFGNATINVNYLSIGLLSAPVDGSVLVADVFPDRAALIWSGDWACAIMPVVGKNPIEMSQDGFGGLTEIAP